MEIRSILTVTFVLLLSCEPQEKKVFEKDIFNSFTKEGSIEDFKARNLREKEALTKIIQHLKSKGLDTDSLFIWSINYSDSDCSDEFDLLEHNPMDACFVLFSLTHKNTIDYQDSLSKLNDQLATEHKDEEWVPFIVPPTGNISGKDRGIFYYFEGDSIVDILSQ